MKHPARNLPLFHHLPLLALSLLGILLSTGCGSGSDQGRPAQLEVSWTIGGASCSAVGLSTVRISLYNATEVFTTEDAACQLGTHVMADIPAGIYTIQIDGFRPGTDAPAFTGSAPDVDVRAGAVTLAPRIELSEAPGFLDITWRFADGKLCGFAGVDTVVLNMWDSHSQRIYQESFPCDPLLAKSEAEARTPKRSLHDTKAVGIVVEQYAGQFTLRAFGMRAGVDLRPTYWAEAKPVVTNSKYVPVDLVLQPCQVTAPDGTTSQVSICL